MQCFAPFNAETPHSLLASRYLTPASLHFVRNHLPVPKHMDVAAYRCAGPAFCSHWWSKASLIKSL